MNFIKFMMMKKFLRGFLVCGFIFYLSCKEEIKPVEQRIIRESELISQELFVGKFKMDSPIGVFASGEVFDGYVEFVCVEFPANISARIYLLTSLPENINAVDQNHEYEVGIFPSSFTCVSEISSPVTFYIPTDVKPSEYFLVAHFVMSATWPVSITSEKYIIEKISVISRWENYFLLSRDVKEIFSIKLTNIIDSFALFDKNLVVFVASATGIYKLEVFPEGVSYTLNQFPLDIEPGEIKVFGNNSDYIVIVNDAEREKSEVISISGDSKNFSHTITYINPQIGFKAQNGYYLLSRNCDGFVFVNDKGISYVDRETCDFADVISDNLSILRGNKIDTISSSGSSTYFVLPDYDYFVKMGQDYVFYSRGTDSIDVYVFDGKALNKNSLNLKDAPEFSEYLPVYKDSVLLVKRYEDSATLYLWRKNFTKEIPNPDKIEVFNKEELSLISFQRGERKFMFFFRNGNHLADFSIDFSGDIIDFSADSENIVLFLKLPHRLGIYTYDIKGNFLDFRFTRNTAEVYSINYLSPTDYIIFFSDSPGCWQNKFCQGNEFYLVSSQSFSAERKFFDHVNTINQKFLISGFLNKSPVFVLQDTDFIRAFSF